jgi:coenzyme F420-reducing hydrogenase alpha subunit
MLLVIKPPSVSDNKMSGEGWLRLKIVWNGKQITSASVRSTRPLQACRLFEGRPAAQAIAAVPLLFSICRHAQVVAAAAACAAARQEDVSGEVRARRERMVAAECLQEYLWRLLLDLPALLGESPRQAEFASLRRRLADTAGRIAAVPRWWNEGADEAEIWNRLADAALAMRHDLRIEPLLERLPAFGVAGEGVALLPILDEAGLSALATGIEAADEFARAPTWHGAAAETGALARQNGHPRLPAGKVDVVAGRLLARLLELDMLPARLREADGGRAVRSVALRPGVGLAAVETARGMLVHHVVMDGEKVARWRIVAPTEWNFHPAGAFVRDIVGRAAADSADVRRAAVLLAHSLDPCVAYEVVVEHA